MGTTATAATNSRPRLGVVTSATGKGGPDAGIAKVHALGFPTCQVHVGMSPPGIVEPLREALAKYQVEATAVMTLGEGRSEEHTSELQALTNLVCRLLLEEVGPDRKSVV